MKLTCIKCERELEDISGMGLPNDGIIFTASGNYGSKVFDPLDGSFLSLVVCDRCAVLHFRELGYELESWLSSADLDQHWTIVGKTR